MHNPEYDAYLNSKAWNNKRKERLKIGKHKCSACGIDKNLQVHHLTYARIFNEEMADLLPLCKDHHELAEEFVKAGFLPRTAHPLFLAAETVRLILTKLVPVKTVALTRKETKRKVRMEIDGVFARNKFQVELIKLDWFRDALKLERKQFRILAREKLKDHKRHCGIMSNAFAVYDRHNQTKLLHKLSLPPPNIEQLIADVEPDSEILNTNLLPSGVSQQP